MNNIYDVEVNDYQVVKGDTINLGFKVFDKKSRKPVDIRSWASKFTLRNRITDLPITALQKTHDDVTVGGDGIYYENDVERLAGLAFTPGAINELIVVIPFADSATLDPDIFPFDIEFTITGLYTSKFTPIRGNLDVLKEHTASV